MTNVEMILSELLKAKEKHPRFCDKFTDSNEVYARSREEFWKDVNSEGPYYATNILQEELWEAVNAYKQGRKEDCLQELAQCGAVVLRMMELVRNKML